MAKFWEKPKHPSVYEWIKKLWYIYTMEYYVVVKKKELLSFGYSMDGPRNYYAK